MTPHHLIGCLFVLLSVVGCSNDDQSRFQTGSPAPMVPAPDSRNESTLPQVTWDVSEIESYFKIVSPPEFDTDSAAFVMIIEATEDGNCVLAPAVPSGFYGFEALLFDEAGDELHVARDIGSASLTAVAAEAYNEQSPRRICVAPPRWTTGTKIRLTIAPGVDRTILANVRRGKVSAI